MELVMQIKRIADALFRLVELLENKEPIKMDFGGDRDE